MQAVQIVISLVKKNRSERYESKKGFRGRNQYETELFEKLSAMEGRYDLRDVFQGFVQYCALYISNFSDGVHFEDRKVELEKLLQKYKGVNEQFHGCLQLLVKSVQYNVEMGLFQDILSSKYIVWSWLR